VRITSEKNQVAAARNGENRGAGDEFLNRMNQDESR
jgi:imidazole glycerol phosphate synthase subunit HisF